MPNQHSLEQCSPHAHTYVPQHRLLSDMVSPAYLHIFCISKEEEKERVVFLAVFVFGSPIYLAHFLLHTHTHAHTHTHTGMQHVQSNQQAPPSALFTNVRELRATCKYSLFLFVITSSPLSLIAHDNLVAAHTRTQTHTNTQAHRYTGTTPHSHLIIFCVPAG